MARLGAVLGGVLAELVRARVIADRLSTDLLAEYEDDEVLATLSVPRITLRNVDLTLRFTVRDMLETAPEEPDVGETLEQWHKFAESTAFGRVLGQMNLSPTETKTTLRRLEEASGELVGRPTRTDIQKALAGKPNAAATKTAAPALAKFNSLPVQLRRKLGGRTVFQRRLVVGLEREVQGFVSRRFEIEMVKAALASTMDVEVLQDKLPDDPARTQEIRLAIHGEDIDLVLANAAAAEEV